MRRVEALRRSAVHQQRHKRRTNSQAYKPTEGSEKRAFNKKLGEEYLDPVAPQSVA